MKVHQHSKLEGSLPQFDLEPHSDHLSVGSRLWRDIALSSGNYKLLSKNYL
jgi:hypothetical protein